MNLSALYGIRWIAKSTSNSFGIIISIYTFIASYIKLRKEKAKYKKTVQNGKK